MRGPVVRRVVAAPIASVLVWALATIAPSPAGAAATWAVLATPNHGMNTNFLYDVSCASTTACVAVGFYTQPGVDKTLIEAWNGSNWKIVPSPSPGAVWNFLYDVDCRSATSCTAVGRYENPSGVNRTLIESWNGTAWSLVPSPNNGTAHNVLAGVDCVSATFCVAVGQAQTGGVARTLVETWNGSVWTLTKSPNYSALGNALSDVACTSATRCFAVGSSTDGHGFARTLSESWDGASWQVVPSPNRGSTGNALTGISCPSPRLCFAAGTYGAGARGKAGLQRTLTEAWDGVGWQLVASPNRGTYVNVLARVSCGAANICKAVGWSQNTAGGSRQTLAERWNGRTWVVMSSPNPRSFPTDDNYLGVHGAAFNGVSCIGARPCAAVGFHVAENGADRSLVERYG